ncbi:MAG: hypothetical protein JWP06_465 [Candidatus Saccharibacteria bacterium]|nr:hypothetical protein [Candidatus Saccharibacteria bacterium]
MLLNDLRVTALDAHRADERCSAQLTHVVERCGAVDDLVMVAHHVGSFHVGDLLEFGQVDDRHDLLNQSGERQTPHRFHVQGQLVLVGLVLFDQPHLLEHGAHDGRREQVEQRTDVDVLHDPSKPSVRQLQQSSPTERHVAEECLEDRGISATRARAAALCGSLQSGLRADMRVEPKRRPSSERLAVEDDGVVLVPHTEGVVVCHKHRLIRIVPLLRVADGANGAHLLKNRDLACGLNHDVIEGACPHEHECSSVTASRGVMMQSGLGLPPTAPNTSIEPEKENNERCGQYIIHLRSPPGDTSNWIGSDRCL